eukprot:s405_g6.t1
MRYTTGGGCLGYPFVVDSEGRREVIRGHSFRMKEPLQYDVESLFPLLAGVQPQDFPDPRLEAPQAEPLPPPPVQSVEPPAVELSPEPIQDGRDSGGGGGADGPEPMTIDRVEEGEEGVEDFRGEKVTVKVPEHSVDELTGAPLNHEQVAEGMKTEVQQLERLKVGRCLVEKFGREMAKQKKVSVLTSRWVLTQKTAEIARCRLVVRDFATGAATAFNSGIYAPTSSLDGLRCVLAVSVVGNLYLLTGDVSVAFMNAPVESDACDLAYMVGIMDSWHEKLKPTEVPPKLEDLVKSKEKEGDEALTQEGEARYRRVLGQLAWAALSRADLCFYVSFLARFQSKPTGASEACLRAVLRWLLTRASEACLRAVLRWLLTRLHRVQVMPSPEGAPPGEPCVLIGYCDASWNVASVLGGVLVYRGCCVKVFSRKQEVPALSSAEAELSSLVENSKELIAVALLLQTIMEGIELDEIGTPLRTTYALVLKNDAKAAISIAQMEGLLRRVSHIELRAKFIQFLVRRRCLVLEHLPGLENPSDGLTKSFKTLDMLVHLEREVGTKQLAPHLGGDDRKQQDTERGTSFDKVCKLGVLPKFWKEKNLLVWKLLLEKYQYDDMGVFDFMRDGVKLVGMHDRAPAVMTQKDLEDSALWRRKAILARKSAVMEPDHVAHLETTTQEELDLGFLEGPFDSEEAVTEYFGHNSWMVVERFVLVQGAELKLRPIDDCLEAQLNKGFTSNSYLKLQDVDYVAGLALKVSNAVSNGSRSMDLAIGWGNVWISAKLTNRWECIPVIVTSQ